jgi:cell division protein FtsW
MMTSASVEIANSSAGDPLYYFKRQAIFACVGIVAGTVTVAIPLALWRRLAPMLMLVSFVLLIAVLIPGIGHTVNGSARWIPLPFFNLQPSELAKLFIIMYLADYLQRNREAVKTQWREFLIPLFISGFAAWLLQMEPDHGALVILMATTFCLLFLADVKLKRFAPIVALAGAGFSAIAYTKPHVIARFTSFLNPWASENVFGDGYQLSQALIAFGRGEWLGTGLGHRLRAGHHWRRVRPVWCRLRGRFVLPAGGKGVRNWAPCTNPSELFRRLFRLRARLVIRRPSAD